MTLAKVDEELRHKENAVNSKRARRSSSSIRKQPVFLFLEMASFHLDQEEYTVHC